MFAGWRGAAAGLSSLCLLIGCAAASDGSEPIGEVSEALSVCDETVPADRYIDGIPAYSQCAGSQNSAIYSNNGIDTSTSSLGAGWIRTQYSGGYQCTELAHRYWLFRWNVSWLPNGNAGSWCDGTPPSSSGVIETSTPVHGDLMVLAPGVCGAGPTTGHVAVVDSFDAARSRVTVVQQNVAGRGTFQQSCATCFLHVVANSGSGGSGGSAGVGGAGGSAGVGAATGCSVATSTAAARNSASLLVAFLVGAALWSRGRLRA